MTGFFTPIPNEIKFKIYSNLRYKNITAVETTCHQNKLDDKDWRDLIYQRFGDPEEILHNLKSLATDSSGNFDPCDIPNPALKEAPTYQLLSWKKLYKDIEKLVTPSLNPQNRNPIYKAQFRALRLNCYNFYAGPLKSVFRNKIMPHHSNFGSYPQYCLYLKFFIKGMLTLFPNDSSVFQKLDHIIRPPLVTNVTADLRKDCDSYLRVKALVLCEEITSSIKNQTNNDLNTLKTKITALKNCGIQNFPMHALCFDILAAAVENPITCTFDFLYFLTNKIGVNLYSQSKENETMIECLAKKYAAETQDSIQKEKFSNLIKSFYKKYVSEFEQAFQVAHSSHLENTNNEMKLLFRSYASEISELINQHSNNYNKRTRKQLEQDSEETPATPPKSPKLSV